MTTETEIEQSESSNVPADGPDATAVSRFSVQPDSIEKTLIECDRFLKLTGIPEERRKHLEALCFRLRQPHNSEMTNELIRSGIAKLIASCLAHPTNGADPNVVVDPKAAVVELRKAVKRLHGNKRVVAKLQKAIQTKKFGGTYQLVAETKLPSPLYGVRVILKKREEKPVEHEATTALKQIIQDQQQHIYVLTRQLEAAPKTHDELLGGILGAMIEMAQRLGVVENILVPAPEPIVTQSSFGARFDDLYKAKMKEVTEREKKAKKEAKARAAAIAAEQAAQAKEQKRIEALKKKAAKSRVSARQPAARSRTRASGPSSSKRRTTASQQNR